MNHERDSVLLTFVTMKLPMSHTRCYKQFSGSRSGERRIDGKVKSEGRHAGREEQDVDNETVEKRDGQLVNVIAALFTL